MLKHACTLKGIALSLTLLAATTTHAQQASIFLADPTIFTHQGTSYLYGTNHPDGFLYYTSKDGKRWSQPKDAAQRLAFRKGAGYGTTGFWAPQIFQYKDSFYMAYTANEQIAIARAASPAGPFTQAKPVALSGTGRQIDPFVFFDASGKVYLYHVKLQQGNRIFVVEMKPDLSDIIPGTEKECISATDTWENTDNAEWPVTEGPTVLKHKNLYYLVYSANDFRNKDYAVGYATAISPVGPWTKYSGNPIISRKTVGLAGTGHGDICFDAKGNMQYVLHTHNSETKVSPRATGVVPIRFKKVTGSADVLEADGKAFRFLVKE